MTTISKKICLLGSFAVGKTSLVRRFVFDAFDDKYISTIGVKVSRKIVSVVKDGEVIDLTIMIWDLSSNERFSRVRSNYIRGAAGAILVCDLTRSETLDGLRSHVDDLYSVSPNVPLVLAANKCDLGTQIQITETQIAKLADELGAPFCLTSAKTGVQVDDLFLKLGHVLVT